MLKQTQIISSIALSCRRHLPGLRLFAALLMSLMLLQSCNKDSLMQPSGEIVAPQPALSIGNVSYDAQHDVLVFPTFEDLRNLQTTLTQLSQNYPADQGNTATLLATLQNIQTNGYYQGSQGSGNQVSLDNFEQSLLASYPLGNDVLLGIMQLNDNMSNGLPTSFLSNVLTANIPFTHEVEMAVTNSSMQSAAKQAILSTDNSTMLVPNFAYNDFLAQFPNFNSLYEKLRIDMANDLAAGMDPGSAQFDDHFVTEEMLRLTLNEEHEVYVEGRLLKLYKDCAWAVFKASLTEAYADLNLLDGDGYVTPPTNLNETPAGLSLATMNTYVPTDYAMVDPDVYDPVTNSAANYEQEIAPNCPEATFDFVSDETLGRTYHFNRYDWSGYPGTDYYFYWIFGDGTGSFEDDPTHTYATDDVYNVKLVIFKEDCGCWDTYERPINTIKMGPSGCSASLAWNASGISNTANFEITDPWNADVSATVTSVDWTFGDDNTATTTGLTVSHTYASNGPWEVWATVHFSNGCISYTNTTTITFPIPNPCCDRDDVSTAEVDPFGLGEHKLIISDRGKGISGGWGIRLQGHQTFYKLNWNDKYRQRFADHDINVAGTGSKINIYSQCTGSFTLSSLSATDPWGASCTLWKGMGVLEDFDISNNGFGMQVNTIHFRHKVKYGGNSMGSWLSVKVGAC